MILKFSECNCQQGPSDFHLTLEPEDRDMGRMIGVLTPREIIPSDRIPQTDGRNGEMSDISWAQRVSGKKSKTPQEVRDQEVEDLEFLLLQAEKEGDEIEDMLDTLSLHWEEDMDRTVFDVTAPFGYTAGWNEVICSKNTQIVRVVGEYQNYFIGSIGGKPPSVYIPKEILPKNIRNNHLHCFYLLDLDFTPGLKNQWRATFCYPPLTTSPMWQTTEFFQSDEDSQKIEKNSFVVPMPPCYIGAIIGKNGKNMNALINRISDNMGLYDSETIDPEITLTPGDDGESILVDVCRSTGCKWDINQVITAVSYMHC